MTELLKSVKADLTDRRLLPIVGLVAVAFVGALAYALLGGGSTSSSPSAATPASPVPAPATGIAVTESQTAAAQAIAETTDGARTQHRGRAHDPFAAVVKVAPAATAASTKSSTATSSSPSSTSSSSSSSSSGSSSSSSSSSGGSTQQGSSSKPAPQPKPKTIYSVALEFGPLPAGATQEGAELKPYAALTKATPLPSSKERLIEYVGVTVTKTGTSASFAVDGEVILHGSGACLPSPTQCTVIDVKEGKTEQLEYLAPSGSVVTYELRVVSIASGKASAASLDGARHAQAKIASGLLGEGGALKAAGLRFSADVGVLVFAGHPAFGAHASSRGRR